MTNGCSALDYSNKYKLVYSGGYDGSFFIWKLDDVVMKDFGKLPATSVLLEIEDIDDLPDSSILHFRKVLEEEFIKS
jgi:WD40 repeat protein